VPLLRRLAAAAVVAVVAWLPLSTIAPKAVDCYPGDPPDLYQACLALNSGQSAQAANAQSLANVEAQVADAQTTMTNLNTLIKALDAQIAAEQALIVQTQTRIDELDRQIRFSDAELVRLRAHLSVRERLLDQRIKYIESHGSVDYLSIAFTANNFNDLMNRLIDSQQVVESDRQLLNDLRAERALVGNAEAEVAGQRSQVAAALKQQKATESDLEKNKAEQAAALVYEAQLEVQLQAQQAQLEAQRAQIDSQVAAEQAQYDAAAARLGGGLGHFIWPIRSRYITNPFGCSQYWFENWDPTDCPVYPYRIHTGIDIAGPYGSPIFAADTGYVHMYSTSYGGGNYVIIVHGNGYSTLYAHMSAFNGEQQNQVVSKGDVIGYEGSTGNSTGPHLHFEIRINNIWKNPCIWLGC
jgi:murein DD-endopeptidase MepM/ murein hydrolase activator NlpD